MSTFDERLAHYRARCGASWRGSDDVTFRIGWNEGAAERDRQLRAEFEHRATDEALASECRSLRVRVEFTRNDLRDAKALLERCQRELAALSCPLRDLFDDIDAMINRKEPR